MLDVKKFKIHEIGIEKVSHFTHCRLHLLPTLFVGTANWFWHRHTPTLANICNQHFQTWPRPLIHWIQQRQQFCHMCPKTIDSKFLGLVLGKKKKKVSRIGFKRICPYSIFKLYLNYYCPTFHDTLYHGSSGSIMSRPFNGSV